MTEKELISKIKELKSIQPSNEWRQAMRSQLLSQADMNAPVRTDFVFDLKLFWTRNFKLAFSVTTVVVTMVIGSFLTISSSNNNNKKLAIKEITPPGQDAVVESSASASPIIKENELSLIEESADKKEEASYPLAQNETAINNAIIEKELKNENAVPLPAPAKPKEKLAGDVKADFQTGLMKERGYGDQPLGGFLMAGDEAVKK